MQKNGRREGVREPREERGLRKAPASGRAAGRALSVNDFAVQREIEAVALDLLRDAQANRDIDDLEDDERDDRVVDNDDGDAQELVHELLDVALQKARMSAELVDREHAGQDGADRAANRMHAEGVERVVIAEGRLKRGRAE